MAKVLITGARGLIGRKLALALLREGHTVWGVSRQQGGLPFLPPTHQLTWSEEGPVELPAGLDAVIHLAGESIASGRWTATTKEAIRHSRVEGTRRLVKAIADLSPIDRPRLLVSASAIGVYGDRGQEMLEDDSPAGSGFLAEVCQAWEQQAQLASELGVQVLIPRLGVVLSEQGGALEKMQPGQIGDGQMWMSWIHIEDVIEFFSRSLKNNWEAGVYNLVAPNPIQNNVWTDLLAERLGFRIPIAAPQFALSALLGEMSQLVTASQRVLPRKLTALGFRFRYPDARPALQSLAALGYGLIEREHWVPREIDEVFEFFSHAENLERITPPWLNFKVAAKSTSRIETGTLIDYRLKLHGVPVTWQSRIEDWKPPREFVDTQVKGPYQYWHHRHSFFQAMGGTVLTDRVLYRLPLGQLGKWTAGWKVSRDVKSIFAYRSKVIAEVFGTALP